MEPQSSTGRPPIIPPISTAIAAGGGDDFEGWEPNPLELRIRTAIETHFSTASLSLKPILQAHIREVAPVIETISQALESADEKEVDAVIQLAIAALEGRVKYLQDQLELERIVARPYRGDPVLHRPEDDGLTWMEVVIQINQTAAEAFRAIAEERKALQA